MNSKRIFRGATGESYIADPKGEIIGRSEFKRGGPGGRIEFSYRNPETDEWEAHHALLAANREGMQPAGFGMDGRTVYMVDNTGATRASSASTIWSTRD